MKVIFTGKVTRLGTIPNPSDATITEVSSGKTMSVKADTDRLVAAGLKEGEEFEIVIENESGAGSSIRKVSTTSSDDGGGI